MFWFWCLIVLLAAPLRAQDCNICGEGNVIGKSLGVVEFVYQGTTVKNSCKHWQEVVRNVNAISDEFCRTEIIQYTIDVCRCSTPEGDLLSDLSPPSVAPTPSSVFVPTTIKSNNATDTNLISKAPTKAPTKLPTKAPTKLPTKSPTIRPTKAPTKAPTKLPTNAPTKLPTKIPTKAPTKLPTKAPTNLPTNTPTIMKDTSSVQDSVFVPSIGTFALITSFFIMC